jgi:hypothetical protein
MTQEPEDRTEFTNLLRRKNVTSWSENVGLKRLSNQRSILVATSVIKVTFQLQKYSLYANHREVWRGDP